jgi:Pentapeptide repeats (8 copies)
VGNGFCGSGARWRRATRRVLGLASLGCVLSLAAGAFLPAIASADRVVNGCTIVSNPWQGRHTVCNRVNLSGVDLRDVNLEYAQLRSANLSGADLSNARLVRANLTKVAMATVVMRWANLSGANLVSAHATWADLTGANLVNADLFGARMALIGLEGANLRDARLDRADLEKANLWGADLLGAKISQVNFTKTILCNTTMPDGLVPLVCLTASRWGGVRTTAGKHEDDPNLCQQLGIPLGGTSTRRVEVRVRDGGLTDFTVNGATLTEAERDEIRAATVVCSPYLEIWGHTTGPYDPNSPAQDKFGISIRCPAGQHSVQNGAGYGTNPPDAATAQNYGGLGHNTDGYWNYRWHAAWNSTVGIQLWGICVKD